MNSFNRTETAIFPSWLCFRWTFPFFSLMYPEVTEVYQDHRLMRCDGHVYFWFGQYSQAYLKPAFINKLLNQYII